MANEAFAFINTTRNMYFYFCPLQVLYNYICIIKYYLRAHTYIYKYTHFCEYIDMYVT